MRVVPTGQEERLNGHRVRGIGSNASSRSTVACGVFQETSMAWKTCVKSISDSFSKCCQYPTCSVCLLYDRYGAWAMRIGLLVEIRNGLVVCSVARSPCDGLKPLGGRQAGRMETNSSPRSSLPRLRIRTRVCCPQSEELAQLRKDNRSNNEDCRRKRLFRFKQQLYFN